MTAALPQSILLRPDSDNYKGYAQYMSDNSVVLGDEDVFSTAAKIAVETATSDSRYVNLRFVYSNQYIAKDANSSLIVASSLTPVEDTTDPLCTLFEPTVGDLQVVFFTHVQSGGWLGMNDESLAFYVEMDPATLTGFITLAYVDCDSLVKLPTHVSFQGDNGMYLKSNEFDGASLLQFSSSDPNEQASGHLVLQMTDGRVQITTDLYGQMWWSGMWIGLPDGSTWVYGDWSDKWDPESAIFTPVKIDDSTIALRSNGEYTSNYFCARVSQDNRTDCLGPRATTITTEARLVVQELVLTRTIYDAVYDMTHARIYNETPYVGGRTTLTNNKDKDATMDVQITYQDEKSYTFSRSVSLSAGVTTSFEVGVPFIEETDIEISLNINGTLDWDTTTTTTTSVAASGSVTVPGKSSAVIEYVGTQGTCDIPYAYTQKDVRSTDGQEVVTSLTDGIYTGVSCYNFYFTVASTQPLG